MRGAHSEDPPCYGLHRTAELEQEIWGMIMSPSVEAHVNRCHIDRDIICT